MMLSPWQWCYLRRPSLSVAPGNQMKNMCSVELCEEARNEEEGSNFDLKLSAAISEEKALSDSEIKV